MFFCHFWLKQVLADINSVQKAVLKYCADNTNPLTQEERSSFLNEYSSLLDVWWSEGTSRSALTKALNECEELKLRIERACSRHQEEIIRRRLASPAATTIADTDSTHVPSTKLVDPNPTITTVDPRTQVLADIDSVLEAIFQYIIDYLDSYTQEERLSFMDEHFSLSDVRSNEGITHSALTEVLDDCKELKSWMEIVCRRRQENIIRRGPAATTADNDSTFSISTTLVGSNQSFKLDSPSSSYETSPSESSVPPNTALTNGSHPGPSCPSTDTSDSTVSSCNAEPHKTPSNTSAGSNTSPASTKKSTWPRAPPTDSDCMIFGGDSFVGSPTFNIDSEGAIGASFFDSPSSSGSEAHETSSITPPGQHTSSTFTECTIFDGTSVKGATINIDSVAASGSRTYYHGNFPSVQVSGRGRGSAAARQTQTAVTVGPNRVVHFSPGAILHSPTMNIQSPGASGSQYYNKSLS